MKPITYKQRIQLLNGMTLNKETGHGRFPVVDQNMKVQGMVTSKDIIGSDRRYVQLIKS